MTARHLLSGALTLLLMAAGALVSPRAYAQKQQCYLQGNYLQCDQGTAFAECQAFMAATRVKYPAAEYGACTAGVIGNTPGFDGWVKTYSAGVKGAFTGATSVFYAYPLDKKCLARSEELGWEGGSTAASVNVCHNGCMYSSSLDPLGVAGFSYMPTGGTCTESDAPSPTPATPGGDGDGDGGGTGGETGGGDGDGGGGGDGDGGGDGGSNGEGGGNGDGDGGGNSDGGGEGDGDGDGDGENPSLPENPTYPGDIPMPYADPPIPSSYLGQWSSGLGGGSCPAAKTITVGVGSISTSVSFEFKPLCDFAQMIRGLVIACAALAAAYIVSGVRK